MKLFQPANRDNLSNDPYMISPKGIKVQVPEARALELMKRGFTLVDKQWRPTRVEVKEDPYIVRDAPLPLEEIKKDIVDILEVTEI